MLEITPNLLNDRKRRKEKVYDKADFNNRVYGMASPTRIEYGRPGELHKDLEDRIGIMDAMTTANALKEGWVRFSARYGELEMHCFPISKAARSIRNLVDSMKTGSCLLDVETTKHTLYEFDDAQELLDWVDIKFL